MISHTLTVIRIFGVFTYTQFHRTQFWDALSQQLQQRGPEYIERCTFRNKPSSDNLISPALFPLSPRQVRDIQQTVPLVKAREQDMKDVSEAADVS